MNYNLKALQGEPYFKTLPPDIEKSLNENFIAVLDETNTTKIESEYEQIKDFDEFMSKDSKKSTQGDEG